MGRMRNKTPPTRSLEWLARSSKLIRFLKFKAKGACKNFPSLKRAVVRELNNASLEGEVNLVRTEKRLEALWEKARSRLRRNYTAHGSFSIGGMDWWFQLALSSNTNIYVKVLTPSGERLYATNATRNVDAIEPCTCNAHKVVQALVCLSAADQLEKSHSSFTGHALVECASVRACGTQAITNAIMSVFEHGTKLSEETPVKRLSELCLRVLSGMPVESFSKAPHWTGEIYQLY